MSDISAQAHRSSDASPQNKLVRMLQNILRSYPKARLRVGRGGFGASLDADTWITIHTSGNLSATELRDLLALFATWCVADPGRIMHAFPGVLDGASAMAVARSPHYFGVQDSDGSR